MIAWSAPSPSRPAPSARRYAALGLDRSAFLSLPMVEAESPPVSGADPPADGGLRQILVWREIQKQICLSIITLNNADLRKLECKRRARAFMTR